jgi:DNA-directed RNA polymerase specialized sigma24 family protein
MALLPPKNYSAQAAAGVLTELKKGNSQVRGDFVWQNQERLYTIAVIATRNHEEATQLTIMAFKNAFAALAQINPKQLRVDAWDWLSQFIVDACAEYHMQNSGPVSNNSQTDPSSDGSAQMDWETTVILGAQRIRRCWSTLPDEQRIVYLLRHQLGLSCEQISMVMHQNPDNVMAWLFRSRVQIVKCLGRG